MKRTELIMGMPVTIAIPDAADQAADVAFDYFRTVDERFSTYKETSEITAINNGLPKSRWSSDMREVMRLCEETKRQTQGFFDISRDGKLDPSGLVKGWAIRNAAELLRKNGHKNFYIDAGGDIQPHGRNPRGERWRFGIRNPFNRDEVVKTIRVSDEGVATSGIYVRGQHIYNPLEPQKTINEIMSLTVIGPNIYEADRHATAAFAMGRAGIRFVDATPGLEGYMIDVDGIATMSQGFERYTDEMD
jgi:thiamine biosynthesis lipoprotein